MARWTPDPTSKSLALSLSAASSASSASRSTIEICGLHAAARITFSAAGLQAVQALFPTRFANPAHPRGYLQTPLHFDTVLTPTHIQYDGVCLSLADAHNATQSLFVSPSQPAVYCLFNYSVAQVQHQQLRKPTVTSVVQHAAHHIFRHDVWVSYSRLLITYSCMQTHSLSVPFADLLLRRRLVCEWTSSVSLKCPDNDICLLNYFSKIRVQECVFKSSKLGLVHSPAGGMFYCGVWCNDQAEYAAPALAYLGGPGSRARQSALNSVRVLSDYFDFESGSIPYSVEVDGAYIGRLDRGDAAMFAWGASLLVLNLADQSVTDNLFPNISFACGLLYHKLITSSNGVIPSQSDELEGRFRSGTHNLATNCLAILAFEAASQVAMQAKDPSLTDQYRSAARELRINTHQYFKCDDERMYTYYKHCQDARGWACLTALAELAHGEAALEYCLNQLWVDDGVLTSTAHSVVWDRTTLYAIRAAFRVGLVELACNRLQQYAKRRLCDTPASPFAVENNESWAQLSAESALYVRVIVEGLLGIDVLSERRLLFRPRCPRTWPGYTIENVFFADVCVTFRVQVVDGDVSVQVESADGGCQTQVDDGYLLLRLPPPPSSPEFSHITSQQYTNIRRSS